MRIRSVSLRWRSVFRWDHWTKPARSVYFSLSDRMQSHFLRKSHTAIPVAVPPAPCHRMDLLSQRSWTFDPHVWIFFWVAAWHTTTPLVNLPPPITVFLWQCFIPKCFTTELSHQDVSTRTSLVAKKIFVPLISSFGDLSVPGGLNHKLLRSTHLLHAPRAAKTANRQTFPSFISTCSNAPYAWHSVQQFSTVRRKAC